MYVCTASVFKSQKTDTLTNYRELFQPVQVTRSSVRVGSGLVRAAGEHRTAEKVGTSSAQSTKGMQFPAFLSRTHAKILAYKLE
jgi:hypothetical protein